MATNTSASPQQLQIIRIALLAGQLLFGAVAWFLTSTGAFEASVGEDVLQILQLAFFVIALGMLGGILLVRHQHQQAPPERRAGLCIAGWAMGEGVALYGAVILLLGGGPLLFLAGLLLFGIAWFLLPIPVEAASQP